MDRALQGFKRANDGRFNLLRVIIVDKDLNEIRILQSHFPGARILICRRHVIKYLKDKHAKPELGKLSADDASVVDAVIHKLVYSSREGQYGKDFASFRALCMRIGMDGFFDYFAPNWDSCQDMWVMHHRASLLHFKNHTNNRLENFDLVIVEVCGTNNKHQLNINDRSCDCSFAMSLLLPCRHAIAFRKPPCAPGPPIPFSRIDERSVPYIIRATNLIVAELADIEDQNEFEDALKFVLNQWIQVRQKAYVNKDIVETETKNTQMYVRICLQNLSRETKGRRLAA
ncbi:hypothetical protein PHMEG_00021147 [Phytophthora megakarya]|uniref:ZSWIM1/3 RNaseH-like domain-containing protein n=1 Tax=Phytophthora megakarya TaxID=4795 RepID=A0A225VMJ6_9STRA|nr:hypothetical protein PHMEG_00021147 [Phytophthora megakarya]